MDFFLLPLVEKLVSGFGNRLMDRAADLMVSSTGDAPPPSTILAKLVDEDELVRRLGDHLVEVQNWSAIVQFFGMSSPEDIGQSTLPLELIDTPRKFRAAGPRQAGVGHVLHEDDLLSDGQHHLLLGDPGAGKTTTIKRLIRRLLLEPPMSERDTWRAPLLVVLRDHGSSRSIVDVILAKLGLAMTVDAVAPRPRRAEGETKKAFEARSRDHSERLYRMTALVLDCLGVCVFLDGLDEVHRESRQALEVSILRLAQHMTSSKLVVSTRSGDYDRQMYGFNVVEICALTGDQIATIAEMWLGPKTSEFLARASDGAARELADRPLFLCQMLLLFRNTESIPDQPSSLTQQMVRLMLQDWDFQRRVTRGSRYSHFGTEAKLDFLSNVAFVMTFGMRSQRFTHGELVDVYKTLWERFQLPSDEAEVVAQEIETHTGIIVEVGQRGFEFSHLSIQEYLAGHYVARLSDPTLLPRLLEISPETLAVATALSSDPPRFLATVMSHVSSDADLRAFVARLVQERPRCLGVSQDHLAMAVLVILFNQETNNTSDYVTVLLDYPGVRPAVNALIERCYEVTSQLTHNMLVLRTDVTTDASVQLPPSGKVDVHSFAYLQHNAGDTSGNIQRDVFDTSRRLAEPIALLPGRDRSRTRRRRWPNRRR